MITSGHSVFFHHVYLLLHWVALYTVSSRPVVVLYFSFSVQKLVISLRYNIVHHGYLGAPTSLPTRNIQYLHNSAFAISLRSFDLLLMFPLDQLQHDSIIQQEQRGRNNRARRSHNDRHLSRDRVLACTIVSYASQISTRPLAHSKSRQSQRPTILRRIHIHKRAHQPRNTIQQTR